MKNQQLGLLIGVVIACLARWFCSTLAGIVFWGDFTNGAWAAIVYSVGYNASYMVPECIICAVLGLLMGKRLTAELRKVK
jgi:thiamine transporter